MDSCDPGGGGHGRDESRLALHQGMEVRLTCGVYVPAVWWWLGDADRLFEGGKKSVLINLMFKSSVFYGEYSPGGRLTWRADWVNLFFLPAITI